MRLIKASGVSVPRAIPVSSTPANSPNQETAALKSIPVDA
jgi:hypothetical protein